MRVGIVILADQKWAESKRRWQRAEELGFAHAWTYDHIGWRSLVDGPWFDAMVTLAAAAGVTSRIRLGTLVASANFRHPVPFAREITALDDLSAGRLTLGVGAGGVGYDVAVVGAPDIPPGVRVARFVEFVELLDQLLRTDGVSFQGQHYTAVDARNNPGCVQSPRVPFVVAANGPRSMRLAARLGAGWVTSVGRAGASADEWWAGARELHERFADAAVGAGRDLSTVDRHLSLDSGPRYSLSSKAYFEDALGRAAELGYTDVVVHWPRPTDWYAGDESILDEIAPLLAP